MLDVDVEKLLPIIITDEIPAPPEKTPFEQRKEQSCVTINNNKDSISTSCPPPASTATPFMSSTPIMPTPTPRRPSLASRKSTDGYRLSMSMSTLPHMPPPPPPSIPPPAIPLTYPGGMPDGGRSARPSTETAYRSSMYAPVVIANARGRKPRASTESISSTASSTRRSISLDSTGQQPWDDLSARTKSGNSPSGVSQRTSKKIILPPSTPPPATPSGTAPPAFPFAIKQMSPIEVHRRRHQKSPSQILSTGFFVSPERSPLSPPMSPLTVQIPRNTPSSRLSMLGASNNNNNNVHAYHSAYNRPDSPTAGYNNPTSPLSSSAPTNKSARAAQIQAQQNRKVRSKSISISQAETQRIMNSAPSSSNMTGPRSPTTMRSTRLADHLPPPSPAHSHFTHLRSPSQSYQQQLISKNGWDGSRPSTATPTSATGRSTPTAGALTKEEDEREREHLQLLQRRSMSLDYWTHLQHLSRSSPTSPTVSEDPEGSITSSVATTERDLDVQTIISDALAIAAAKSAAIEAAKQSAWYRQQELQRLGGNGITSRPWTPSEDQWGSTSLSSSRSQSPFYSTSTPSPSH
ncbi:hypothetical protein BGZ58_003264 [Dissophora ornata]|nr:hypothetical protein BGZ58_003264 [Dissophora ornata]